MAERASLHFTAIYTDDVQICSQQHLGLDILCKSTRERIRQALIHNNMVQKRSLIPYKTQIYVTLNFVDKNPKNKITISSVKTRNVYVFKAMPIRTLFILRPPK